MKAKGEIMNKMETFFDWTELLQMMEEISREPKGSLFICGEEGSGKTTLLKQYIEKCAAIHGSNYADNVILHISVPYPVTLHGLVEAFLEQAGDSYPKQGTLNDKMNRIKKLIPPNRKKVILIDDFQNLIVRRTRRIKLNILDWFCYTLDDLNMPFVLFGDLSANDVLNASPQLSTRVNLRRKLKPFDREV